MKNTSFLLCLALVLFTGLLSCQKENNPNYDGPLLLSKVIFQDGKTYTYTYNESGYLVSNVHRLPNEELYRIEFIYNESNRIIKNQVIDLKTNKLGFHDTIIYKDDYSSYTYQSVWGSESQHYYNSNDKVYHSVYHSYMTVDEYPEDHKVIEKYFSLDSTYLGEIEYIFDNNPNPQCHFPYLNWFNKNNIISMHSDSVNENGNIYIDFQLEIYGLGYSDEKPYTCTYQYNKQGYPVIQSKWINGVSEPKLTYFEYIPGR